MLLSVVCSGAWAELRDGSTIVLQSNYLTNDWLTIPANDGTTVKAAATESNIVFQLVSAQEGGFYLQEVLSGKYVGKTAGTGQVPVASALSDAGRYDLNLRSGTNVYAVTCKNPSSSAGNASLHHSGANVTAWEGASTNAQGSWWNVTEVEPVFKIQNAATKENRGYLAAWTTYTNGPSLADCNYTGLQSNHPLSTDDGVSTLFYMLRVGEKLCMFSLADAHGTTPKFLDASTSPTKWSETPYLLTIVRNTQTGSGWTYTVKTNTSTDVTLNYNMIARADATNTVVSAACGTESRNGSVKTDTNTADGGVPFRFYVQKDFAPTANQTTMINTAKEFFAGPDWDGLAAIVTEAESYTIGTGYGEYTDGSGFGFALNQAQTMLDNHENNPSLETTKELVDEAINDLRTAINGLTLNMPQPNTFLRIKGLTSDKYITGNGTSGQVVLSETADINTVLYYDESNHLIGYVNGRGFNGTHSVAGIGSFETHTFSEAPFKKGCYLIKSNYSGSQVLVDWTDGNLNRWSTENDTRSTWLIEAVTELPVNMVNVAGAYYASLHLPVAVTLPAGVTAYSGEVHGDVLSLTEVVTGGNLKESTPVILYSGSEVTEPFAITTTGEEAGTNELIGTLAAESATDGSPNYGAYVLNKSDNNVGFYKTTTKINGFKAYLPAGVGGGVNALSFSFEDITTAIDAIENANTKAEIFDLNGRKLNRAQKGMNIINGMKVLVK